MEFLAPGIGHYSHNCGGHLGSGPVVEKKYYFYLCVCVSVFQIKMKIDKKKTKKNQNATLYFPVSLVPIKIWSVQEI